MQGLLVQQCSGSCPHLPVDDFWLLPALSTVMFETGSRRAGGRTTFSATFYKLTSLFTGNHFWDRHIILQICDNGKVIGGCLCESATTEQKRDL